MSHRPVALSLLAVATVAALAAPALARRVIAPLPSAKPTASAETAPAVKAVRGWLGKLTVRAPRSYKGLKVFPLTAWGGAKLGDVLTLDEALKSNALKVTEMEGGARVNELRLENLGAKPVFVMGGEIMRGAKQDRTLQADLLVPAKSGPLIVKAFCTEHGRWTEQSANFKAADAAVPNSVRGVAKGAREQGSVWDSIATNQSKLRVSAPTSAAKQVYEDKRVQADIEPYVKAMADLPRVQRDMVGVVVTYGGKLVAVDVFGDASLSSRLYPKLLRSYVVDVVADPWNGDRSEDDVRALLTDARDANWGRGETDGIGAAVEYVDGKQHGSALVNAGAVLHLDVFEGDDVVKPREESWQERRRNVDQVPSAPNNRREPVQQREEPTR